MEQSHICPICGSRTKLNIDLESQIFILKTEIKDLQKKLDKIDSLGSNKEPSLASKQLATNYRLLIKGKEKHISELKKQTL